MNPEKPSPIKPAGIRDWIERAQKLGLIEAHAARRLVVENEQTQTRLKEYGLPSFEVYGVRNSFEEFEARVSGEMKKSGRFLVRCAPRDMHDPSMQIQRTLNVSFEEARGFVAKLPGGSERYTIELREYWDPDYGGTVIANGQGKVIIEMIAGRHADIDRSDAKALMHGEIDFERDDIHFQYRQTPSSHEQEVMMGAVRHFASTLEREQLENLRVYAEFVYKNGRGYRFIDISDEKFWTKL